MATTPANARPRPTMTLGGNRRPPRREKTAIHAACRHTSAVAAATDVSVSERMKHTKWKARATPAAADQTYSRRPSRLNCPGCRIATGAAMTTAARALRQNAMARAVTELPASVAAMSGPDEDTPRTPSAAMRRVTGSLYEAATKNTPGP